MTDVRAQVESQTPLARPAYRADIQGLRALAVVLVVAWHAGVTQFRGGFIGVDVFFVISGYVITSLLRRQPHQSITRNLRAFYARRIRRIVPAATVVLIVTVVAAYITSDQNLPNLIGDVRWATFFGANLHFISTTAPYPIPGTTASLVTHFWSLAVEEQFYFVWPLVLFSIMWWTPARQRTVALATGLGAIIVASAAWSAYVSPVNSISAFYSPFTRAWELALGALVSLVPARWAQRLPELCAVLGWTALLAIVACATTISYTLTTPWPGTLAWWPCAATAVVLATGAAEAPLGPLKVLGTRGAQYVGDRSYSLYLWHYVWLMLLISSNPFDVTYTTWWIRVFEVAGACVCAAVSYRFLENPIRHSKLLDRDPTAVFIMLAVCIAASLAATYVVAHLANIG